MEEVRICTQCQWKRTAKGRTICNTCRTANYTKKNPARRIFLDLRSSAKKREIQFNLTFEQFKKFILKTDYLEGRGREADSLTIDRIHEELGYFIGNMQVITKSENSTKFHEYYRAKRKIEYDKDMADVPF